MESYGADYAEYIERLDHTESIRGGDIVGLIDGKITKQITGSHRIMIVSTMPIVVGNMVKEEDKHKYNPVAFVGQVPVHVHGRVKIGDYIIPSGKEDGTGIAVSPDNVTADQLGKVVGQAWTGADELGLNKITVAITPLDFPTATLKNIETENQTLKEENQALKESLESLTKRIERLEKRLN